VIEDGKIKDSKLFGKLEKLMEDFGGDLLKIKKAIAIDNLNLRKEFETRMESIAQKQKASPNLFKKFEWEKPLWTHNFRQRLYESDAAFQSRKQEFETQRSDGLRRKQFIQYLSQKISGFRDEFNDGSKV